MGKRTGLRLSRSWRAARNFGAAAVLVCLCAGLFQFPLIVTEWSLRTEAADLGAAWQEVEILWRGVVPYNYMGQGGSWAGNTTPLVLARAGDRLLRCELSRYEGDVHLSDVGRWAWPKEVALLPILPNYFYDLTRPDTAGGLLAVNLPQEAHSGWLVLDLGPYGTATVSGVREQSVIFFWVSGTVERDKRQELWGRLVHAPYTLTLLDEQGNVLAERWGTAAGGWR